MSKTRWVTTLSVILVWAQIGTAQQSKVLVKVKGQSITAADLEFAFISRRIPEELRESVRERFLDVLIDKKLLAAFLAEKRVEPNKAEVDAQVEALKRAIKTRGNDPAKVLGPLGYTDQALRNEFALPSAWRTYARLVIAKKDISEYWEQHRSEFDGTRITAAHIVKKVKKEDGQTFNGAIQQLEKVRSDILAKKLTFTEAAAKHSDSPTKTRGGDLGSFRFGGRMPPEIDQVAFQLQDDEISKPFRTRFGVHILTVTKRSPGQLSLEDVRENVFKALSLHIQHEVIRKQRESAKIERTSKAAS